MRKRNDRGKVLAVLLAEGGHELRNLWPLFVSAPKFLGETEEMAARQVEEVGALVRLVGIHEPRVRQDVVVQADRDDDEEARERVVCGQSLTDPERPSPLWLAFHSISLYSGLR